MNEGFVADLTAERGDRDRWQRDRSRQKRGENKAKPRQFLSGHKGGTKRDLLTGMKGSGCHSYLKCWFMIKLEKQSLGDSHFHKAKRENECYSVSLYSRSVLINTSKCSIKHLVTVNKNVVTLTKVLFQTFRTVLLTLVNTVIN